MKKCLFFLAWWYMISCRKPAVQPGNLNSISVDSSAGFTYGDTLTYEVITDDTTGWFGMWNESDGTEDCNPLDNINYGSPIYNYTGWRHTIICPNRPFQAFISVANRLYNNNIQVNLYRNNILIKSSSDGSSPAAGVANLMLAATGDSLRGTAQNPVLTYEVLMSQADSVPMMFRGWAGQWNLPDGTVGDLNKPLLRDFAIPSGWRYTFTPRKLPFTMYVFAAPAYNYAGTITINYYVNGAMVKTISYDTNTYQNYYEVR